MMSRTSHTKISLILPAAAIAMMTMVGCSDSKPATQPPAEKVHGVALMQVQKATVPDAVEATGTVRAVLSAQLASQVMGTITRVNVHEGDRVQRGEVLVSIDEAQQQAAYSGRQSGVAGVAGVDCGGRRRLRAGRVDAEALPDALRQEIGEPAGV